MSFQSGRLSQSLSGRGASLLFSLFRGQRKTRNANMTHLNIHLHIQRCGVIGYEVEIIVLFHFLTTCTFFFGVLALVSVNHRDIVTLKLRHLGCYEANSLDHGSNN